MSVDAYQDMQEAIQGQDCATIQDNPRSLALSVCFCGKRLDGHFTERTEALAAICRAMKHEQYWPNIYHINERGNVEQLGARGQVINSWV